MKYAAVLISVVIVTTCQFSHAQDKVFEVVDKDMNPREIELLGTGKDDIIIHYIRHNKATGYEAKVHNSCLLFPAGRPNRITLPYSLDIRGVGYTNDFYTFIGTHRNGRVIVEDGRVTVFKIDKQGRQTVKGFKDLDLQDEYDRFLFSEGGAIYVITSIKKQPRIRIRRILDLDVEIFDFAMSKDQIGFWGSTTVYIPPAQTDPIPADIDLKVFIRDGRVVIADRNPKASPAEAMLTLYEFSLSNPATFTSRPINLPGSRERLAVAPVGDRLFLYETAGRTAKVHIMDFKTLQVLKTFSSDEPNSPMLLGDLYKTGAYGKNYEKRKDGEGTAERKLDLITRLRPWIQAWPVDEMHVKVSFGDYTMSGTLKEFNYLNLILNPATFEVAKDNPAPSRRQFLLEKLYGERDTSYDLFGTYYSLENSYTMKYDLATGTLTVWK
jgi:hypothetical protein